MGLFDLFGKKQQAPASSGVACRVDLLGDDRDDALTEYQLEGVKILARMFTELEVMRRRGELIERRFYGFHYEAETEDEARAIVFERPEEGVELMRRYAGKPTRWFRLREEEDPADYEPFEGEPARFRVTDS